MEKLIRKLQADFPAYHFVPGVEPRWSPQARQVAYIAENTPTALFGVLHELGHALLDHKNFDSDIALLQKEASAWEKAVAIATVYDIRIDEDHIQNCLDTYRDWLHKRSTCPKCQSHGVQYESKYTCLNCSATWGVTAARFCRPYRMFAN